MGSRADRILINCDIGERGPDNETDLELMRWIDIANLACGGHAGDYVSVDAFRRLADKNRVIVTAHLSYPDREGFGRKSLGIPVSDLIASLEDQYALLPGVETVKFHGALYNDSCRNDDLARELAAWLARMQCKRVLTLPGSALDGACRAVGIEVLAEAFAERRYLVDPETGTVSLVGRDRPDASIETVEEAVSQAEMIALRGELNVSSRGGSDTTIRTVPVRADTICIHSDSVIAIPLARKLARLLTR